MLTPKKHRLFESFRKYVPVFLAFWLLVMFVCVLTQTMGTVVRFLQSLPPEQFVLTKWSDFDFTPGFRRRNTVQRRNYQQCGECTEISRSLTGVRQGRQAFRPSATVSQDGLMESCTCRHCRCHGGTPPPPPPPPPPGIIT